jgi:integrase
MPALTYPSAPPSRLRFLSRDKVARLIWACWRHRTPESNFETHPLRHVARFILMGIYTGTRSGAILTSSFAAGAGRSYVDMDDSVFHRLADGKRATNKRQPPVRLPWRLLAHMKRWHANQKKPCHVIAWRGDSVASVKKGFAHAVKLAGLEGQVTPHVLRHTFMTWTLNASVPLFVAAKIAGMSPKAAGRVYGHLDSSRNDALDAVFYGRNMGRNSKPEKRKA